MGLSGLIDRADRPWRILLALLCVLLVLVAGTVQVAHNHADGADRHADCPLCVAAHATVHIVKTPAAAPSAAVVARVEALLQAVFPSAPTPLSLFIRPPPVAVVPA
jgi:hypothetical protein